MRSAGVGLKLRLRECAAVQGGKIKDFVRDLVHNREALPVGTVIAIDDDELLAGHVNDITGFFGSELVTDLDLKALLIGDGLDIDGIAINTHVM